MATFWGVGDAARPEHEAGYTADVFPSGDVWRVGLVAWAANGLGSEVYDHPTTFPTEAAAIAAAPDVARSNF